MVALRNLLGTVFLMACSADAAAFDNPILTIGVKSWVNTWSTWRPQNVFYSTGPIQVSEPVDSVTRVVVTPSVTVGWERLSFSTSYLLPQTYPLSGALDTRALSGRRRELDLNGGYKVFRGLLLSVGFKEVYQDYGAGALRWRGPTFGVVASAPLLANWTAYGNYGYGPFRLTTPAGSADSNGRTAFDASYNLGELGIAYDFNVSKVARSIRVTLGYRVQLISTRGYALQGRTDAPNEHDNTQGPAVSLLATL